MMNRSVAHLPECRVPQLVLDLTDQRRVRRVAGQHHTRTGIPSRVTAMPTMTCGRSSRESLDLPNVRNPTRSAAPSGTASPPSPSPSAVAAGVDGGRIGEAATIRVAPDRLVRVLEVGAGGVSFYRLIPP